MAVVIADLRQHLEGQLTAKKNALNETEDNLRKYVGDRAVENQGGGRPGRGRGGFAAGRGLVRGRSLQERLGNLPHDGERGGLGERDVAGDRAGGDMEEVVNKSVMSRVVKEVKSREETLEEQKSDKKVVDRNRRMFGALVGTLQKFNKEEIKKKDVLEKKKVVEKKVEEKTEREKEEIKNRKRELFDEQKKKKKDIQIIQIQMKRVEEYEAWEKSKKSEVNFIRTKTSQPEIYWLPKQHSDKSEALLVESREAVEKEIEERKEKFEAELISIEKRMTQDLDRRRSGGKSDGDRLDQSAELDESMEGKQEEEEEEEEGGFMQDRRVVERDPDQNGAERNGDGGDLRMTLKNDLASHVNGSERIVRRKEDVEDKNGEKEERRIVVKDEKEVEERKVRREQDRQREEERKIRKEEEKRRDQKRRSDKSEERTKTNERVGERDRSKDKIKPKVPEEPMVEDKGRSNDKVEASDNKIDLKPPSLSNAATEENDKARPDSRKDQPEKRPARAKDSSSDSEDERKPRRVPARKRQRSGRTIRRDDKSRKRDESSDTSSEEERRPRKRRTSTSSSSDSEDERRRRNVRSRRGARATDKKRSKSSSSDDRRKKVRKGSKPESSSEDSSSDSD